MKHLIASALIVLTITLFCCTDKKAVEIPYPLPVPDTSAIVFLPGIVSSDSFDFNACFSADGKSYYFTRNENDRTLIYVIRHDGTNWGSPQLTSFTDTAWSQADPAFAPDGKMYFISNRPKDANDTLRDFDIWFSNPLPNGEWSAPENFKAINSDSNEYYMSFTAAGNVYFGSSRNGSAGQEDIYVSRLENGVYTTPENLGVAVNTDKAEFDPFITHDEKLIIFASSNREDGLGRADLYYSKYENGAWTKAANLGKHINTATRDFCPYISRDGKYFFFSSNRDVKWIKAEALNR
ncbi:MAG: hypothetical protein U0U09_01940 [Cyclobacteriaceae bacterium]